IFGSLPQHAFWCTARWLRSSNPAPEPFNPALGLCPLRFDSRRFCGDYEGEIFTTSPIHLLTQFFPFCRFWLPLLLPFLLPLLVAVLQGRIIAWYNIAGLKRLAGNPSPLMIGSLHLPCIYRKQTRCGKEGACPPSRQAQDKFACRRDGLPCSFQLFEN